MSHYSGNIDNFGMDTVSLTGPLQARLQAVREAGFSQLMLAAEDLVGHPEGLEAALTLVRASGLRVTGLQLLRDFEGLCGPLHAYKIDVAQSMLALCRALDCRLLLVQATTLSQASVETRAILRDLRKLAMLAIPMNIRIAYSASPQARSIKEFPQAWDLVCEADMPNLGLCLGADTFELFANGLPLDEIEMLDPEKVFLVQLADFMQLATSATPASEVGAQPVRLFPGAGVHSEHIATLVTRLHTLGYRGDYSFGVCNSDYRQMSLASVAERARRAALWLGEGVLQRSVPLPNHIRLKRTSAR